MSLTQLVRIIVGVENGFVLDALDPIVPQHSSIFSRVLTLDLECWCGRLGFEHEVVVAVRAVLVGVLKLPGVFAEAFLALLAGEDHLEALQEGVGLLLGVALTAVKPFLACGQWGRVSQGFGGVPGVEDDVRRPRRTAWRPDRDLGVEDVFAEATVSWAPQCSDLPSV